jgi:hypothetical protein
MQNRLQPGDRAFQVACIQQGKRQSVHLLEKLFIISRNLDQIIELPLQAVVFLAVDRQLLFNQ